MARNKYPEETVNRILDVSLKLFLEQGYDYTTIQDIIDHLGGLSKGAIYHHFKSKEDILGAAGERLLHGIRRKMSDIRDNKEMNGREKLETMFRNSMTNPDQLRLLESAPDLRKNPRLLLEQFEQTTAETIPLYVEPVIREGVADGSIVTEYPEELAEVIMVLTNIWMNPLLFSMDEEKLLRKLRLLDRMLKGTGLDFIGELQDGFVQLLQAHIKAE